MYTKRIWKKGAHENQFWFELRQAWCKASYEEHWGNLTKIEMFRDFSKFCQKYGIDWTYAEDGELKTPTLKEYETATKNGYFTKDKYDWDGSAEQYENDHLPEIQKKVTNFAIKQKPAMISAEVQKWHRYNSHEDTLFDAMESTDVWRTKLEYRLKATRESKNMTLEAIRTLAESPEEDSQNEENNYLPVSDTPLHEDEDLQDMWNDFFSEMVDDRE